MAKKNKTEELTDIQIEEARAINKKRTIIGCGIIVAAIICTICVVAHMSKSTVNYEKMDFDQYIKVGNYKGLEYEMSDEKITDKDVEEAIRSDLAAYGKEKTKKGAAEDGDIAILNFEGKVDGKKVDDASANDFTVEIGRTALIDGFGESIIGHKAGDKYSVDLKFPDDYGEESVAGKPVVFDIEVVKVKEYIMPELTDAFVEKNTEYKTVKEYKEATRKDLEDSANFYAESSANEQLWNTVIESSKIIKYPKNSIKNELEILNAQQEAELKDTYNMTLEEALEQSGVSKEDYDKQMKSAAKEAVKHKLVGYYIAKKEKADISDKAYDAFCKDLLDSEGYTEESFEENFGSSFDDYCKTNDIYSTFVMEQAVDKVRELGKNTSKK